MMTTEYEQGFQAGARYERESRTRDIEMGLALLAAFRSNINPHVLPDMARAIISDEVLAKVDQEAIASWMIESRQMHMTIKWLIDHIDECHHAELDRGPDNSNLLITTLDDVQQWLEDMSGVLGAEGYDASEEPE